MKNSYNKLKKFIKNSQKIAIFWHTNPDWDTIWWSLAIWTLLKNIWKEVHFFTPEKPSKTFNMIKNINFFSETFDYWKYDLIFFIDFSNYDRIIKFTKWKEKYFEQTNTIIIDHHIWKTANANLIIKDDTKLSVCEIIADIFKKIYIKQLTTDIANYIFLWILTDSWYFKHWTNEQFINILDVTKFLIKKWADKEFLTYAIFNNYSLNSVLFSKFLLERIEQQENILYTYFTNEDLKKYWIDIEEAKISFNWIIRKIKWIKIFILFYEKWDKIKCSMRWSYIWRWINLSNIAKNFWWGGHKQASWFNIKFEKNIWIKKQINDIVHKINWLI